jgi:hypothetical protein
MVSASRDSHSVLNRCPYSATLRSGRLEPVRQTACMGTAGEANVWSDVGIEGIRVGHSVCSQGEFAPSATDSNRAKM